MNKEKALYDLLFGFTSRVFSYDEQKYEEIIEMLYQKELINVFKEEFNRLFYYELIEKGIELNNVFGELKNIYSSNINDDYTFLIRFVVHMFSINEKLKEVK